MRPDLNIILDWIEPGSRVLDLGCGDGTLLKALERQKQVHGWGVEIDPKRIQNCVEVGVNVIEHNLDQGLAPFRNARFETVVLSQTLQAVRRPDQLIEEMLEIGDHCIVTFPNFGHWRARVDQGLRGRMPVSEFMPYSWYNTPNIHFCTVKDFEALCRERGIRILDQTVSDRHQQSDSLMRAWPNLLAEIAIYRISR